MYTKQYSLNITFVLLMFILSPTASLCWASSCSISWSVLASMATMVCHLQSKGDFDMCHWLLCLFLASLALRKPVPGAAENSFCWGWVSLMYSSFYRDRFCWVMHLYLHGGLHVYICKDVLVLFVNSLDWLVHLPLLVILSCWILSQSLQILSRLAAGCILWPSPWSGMSYGCDWLWRFGIWIQLAQMAVHGWAGFF